MTDYNLAIKIFDYIDQDIGVEDKMMADFGAGTGMLSITGVIFGVQKSLAVEMDKDAI